MLYVSVLIEKMSREELEKHYSKDSMVRAIKSFQHSNKLHVNTAVEIIGHSSAWVGFSCDSARDFFQGLGYDAKVTAVCDAVDLDYAIRLIGMGITQHTLIELDLRDLGYFTEDETPCKCWCFLHLDADNDEYVFDVPLLREVDGSVVNTPDKPHHLRRFDYADLMSMLDGKVHTVIQIRKY